MNWDDFEVTTAVVHYVPTTQDEDEPELLLTDEAIELDAGLKRYFRDKIADRLKGKGLEVVVDAERDQIVPDAVAEILPDPDKLVDASKRIAIHLDSIQSKVNSSGLLAVVLGTLGSEPCLSIIKLERERGVRFAIDTVAGKHIVDLELLRNLTLTDKTKVYKTALLSGPGGANGSAVTGWVADDQRGKKGGVQVASFFLSKFLGCTPKLPAAKITYDFVKAANTAFNEDVASPERKGRYQVALLAVLQDNTADLRPKTFANTHLESSDRPVFLKRVREAGLDPDVTFAKDTSLIKTSNFRMTFKSGMVLIGDMDALDNKVELPVEKESGDPVQLHDTIERVLTGR